MMWENMKGGLWRTSGGRITLDNQSGESFSENAGDKLLMTKEELTKGINEEKFMLRFFECEK